MARSTRLRLADYRYLARLVAECRDLGDDGRAWRRHLGRALMTVTGPTLIHLGELGGLLGKVPYPIGVEFLGVEYGFDQAAVLACLARFDADPYFYPVGNAYVSRLRSDPGAALARTDLISDADWYRCEFFKTFQQPMNADEALLCARPLPGNPDRVFTLNVIRERREPGFRPRQKAVVEELIRSITPLVGGPLAHLTEPAPGALPPRRRQVLRCALEGDSDKQIGLRLGMTRNTVNGHLKAIFRHFDVQTRAELLSRWVRRGWGLKSEW